MKFVGIIFIAFLSLASVAHAQFQPTPAGTGGPVAVGQAMAQVDPQGRVAIVGVPQAPPTDTSVSFGSLGAQLLAWLGAIFIPVIGAFATKALMAIEKKAGIEASKAASDHLDDTIENGLHAGLGVIDARLAGTMNVDVKNKAIADAVSYAQDHGAETIKSLTGLDPNDPKVIETLQARATKAMNNVVSEATAPAAPPAAATAPAAAPQPQAAPAPVTEVAKV
jgi:hypothetical protein